jgi:archaellum component FlaG (FlaF/FlaG flagellin family)
MRRVKTVSASLPHGDVEITIRIKNTCGLTMSEVETSMSVLTDDAMRSLSAVRYFSTPLSAIKVK